MAAGQKSKQDKLNANNDNRRLYGFEVIKAMMLWQLMLEFILLSVTSIAKHKV